MEDNKKQKIDLIKKSFELKHLKKYKEAIEVLYKALEFDNALSDNIELLSQIGDLHILLKNYDRALDEFQKALSINKHHAHSIQKCYEIYYKTDRLDKALKIARKMCEEDRTAYNYHNYLKVLIKMEKYQEAMDVFNKLHENLKLDTDILYLISTISNDKRHLLLEKIICLEETHKEANQDLAAIEFNRGNYDKTINYCLNLDDDNPTALYYLAKIEAIRQNYTKAIDLYLTAIKYDNDEHDYYLDLAKSYIDISWLDEALVALKKSINLSLAKNNRTNLDEKYFLSGWILIKQDEHSRAVLNLAAIGENSPLYSKAQVLLQTINFKNSLLADALFELEKHYSNEPNNPILLDTLAATYKELKLYKKAIGTYKKAIKIYPASIYYKLELIDLLIDNKNYDEAYDLIVEVSQKYENCASIYNSLARIYYRLNDLDKALLAIDKYIELDNNNCESYYFKGLILNDLERFSEAKEFVYSAIRINPRIAKYYSQMARSYSGLGEYENALLYSKEAIEINPDEISFKKQAYDISVLIGNDSQIETYRNQLKRSEAILRLKR